MNPVEPAEIKSIYSFEGNLDHRVRALTPGGEQIYDVTYRYKNGRRITPGQPANPSYSILILGCSLALGEGLEENHTVAAFLQRRLKDGKVENVSGHGWNPADHLFYLRRPEVKNNPLVELPDHKVIVIFLFFTQHMWRMECPLSCQKEDDQMWLKSHPNFILNQDDELEYKGTFLQTKPRLPRPLQLIADSAFFAELGVDWPPIYSAAQQHKMARLMISVRDEILKKADLAGFYFVLHPLSGRAPVEALKQELAGSGINTLDSRKLDVFKLTGNRAAIPFDGHPSPQTNFILAEYLRSIIEKDYPDLN